MVRIRSPTVRKRAAKETMEVYFFTDPLCPWSWAMEPAMSALRAREDIEFHSILVGWLPSLAGRTVEAVAAEWSDAAAKTRARIDPTYWDRVAPKTGLIADVAVKAGNFQGAAKGEAYLTALRRAVFEDGMDVADPNALASLADACGLNGGIFRGDLGVGRYAAAEVVAALDPKMGVADSVSWFGRWKVLRSWEALAEDIRNAERQKVTSPAIHFLRGKKEAVLRGYASGDQIDRTANAI